MRPIRTAAPFVPPRRTLPVLRAAVERCRGCELWRDADHGVFGEGPIDARAMFVGESPGDVEDRKAQVFVGPAGRVLEEAFLAAGIDRRDVFLTNAVKHFKYTLRGKRRVHDKPTRYEVRACRPWLDAELALVAPELLVVLGATAAQSLLGTKFRVTRSRGVVFASPYAKQTIATVHPASVLRAPDEAARQLGRDLFFADIALVAKLLAG